jgi:hypothetical protein
MISMHLSRHGNKSAEIQKRGESFLMVLAMLFLFALAFVSDSAVATHSGDWLEPVVSLPRSLPRLKKPPLFPPGVIEVQRKGLNASDLSASTHASIAEEEADPKLRRLHVCVDPLQAYPASWLVTAKYLAASEFFECLCAQMVILKILYLLCKSKVPWTSLM